MLGLVSQSQNNVIRDPKLQRLPVGSDGLAWAITSYYNAYVSDTFRIKPRVTLTYGLGYLVQMPPAAQGGVPQITLMDQNGNQVSADYLTQVKKAALSGQGYAPILSSVPLSYVGDKPKYPYNPFYGGLAPRVSVAWSPNVSGGVMSRLLGKNKSVVRVGYGRIGRLNAIRTMSSPMQFPGTTQAVTCPGPSMNGQCTGNNGVTPSTSNFTWGRGLGTPSTSQSSTAIVALDVAAK